MSIAALRKAYHEHICQDIIRLSGDEGQRYPNFADTSSKGSRAISWGIVRRLECDAQVGRLAPQTIGKRLEEITREFLEKAFGLLQHLRPGRWQYDVQAAISEYDQYEHLAGLERISREIDELASALGADYIIKPDIVIGRWPVSDAEVNREGHVIDAGEPVATLTPLRQANIVPTRPILHASVSCKWTLRSDRAQNARAEALNLIRNRKGNLPHVVAVTAEPLPMRIAALALGTGDLDCVYHIALRELQEAVQETKNEDQGEMLAILVNGRRLRDISDLPFDLAT